MLIGVIAWFFAATSLAQDRNAEAVARMHALERELHETAATMCNRVEFSHMIVYFDKTLMGPDDERAFGERLDRGFAEVERLLDVTFDPASRGVAKPTAYLTDRAGLSRANGTEIILRAARVVPGISIAFHEMTHLLVARDVSAPRNRDDLSPAEEARVNTNGGAWIAEGFADYVSFEIAARFGLEPADLFDEGKSQSEVDTHARTWLKDPRGRAVLPFVGSHGIPDNLMADRENVAPPFYVLGHSFVNFLVRQFGANAVFRVYDKQSNGTDSIEHDFRAVTGANLASVRREWLNKLRAVG